MPADILAAMKGLVAYISTGHGFKSPAEAVAKELTARGHDVACLDFLKEAGVLGWHNLLTKSWTTMLGKPLLFKLVFPLMNGVLSLPLKKAIELMARKKVLAYLDREKPDFVFSTHFGTTAVFNGAVRSWERKTGRRLPFFAYNSDVILSHVAYIAKRVTRYFVATERCRDEMVAHGQAPESVVVAPFPIDPKYSKKFGSVRDERATLGLKDMFTVVMSMGGEGIGDFSFIERLAASGAKLQLVVVCGRNEAALARLEAMKAARPDFELVPLGFVTNMQDYLYACDVAAGKAGLNTIFESIAMKKPFLALMAMANETIAARFLSDEGYGIWARNAAEAAEFVERAASDPAVLAPYRERLEKPPCAFGAGGIADAIEREARTGGSTK